MHLHLPLLQKCARQRFVAWCLLWKILVAHHLSAQCRVFMSKAEAHEIASFVCLFACFVFSFFIFLFHISAVDDLYNMCEFVSDIEKCERY